MTAVYRVRYTSAMETTLTTTEAAERARISPRGIRKAIARGVLPARKVGRDWLITEAELVAWLARREAREEIDSRIDSQRRPVS